MLKTIYFFIKNIFTFPIYYLKNSSVGFSSRISSNVKISRSKIGNYCYIANNVNIVNSSIGNYCSIAPGVQIGGMEHSYWWHSTSTFLSDKCISDRRTIIEDDVWIAAGAIIKQGVKIGRGSVIGAMSFVNKDVPPNTIVVGIPAKVVRPRMEEGVFTAIENSKYWELTPDKAREKLGRI